MRRFVVATVGVGFCVAAACSAYNEASEPTSAPERDATAGDDVIVPPDGGYDASSDGGPCNCQGGVCLMGVCQPFIFVHDEPGIVGLEIIDTDLVWTRPSSGLVRAMPLDKSSLPHTIVDKDAGGPTAPWGLSDVAGTLLLTDRANGVVARWVPNGTAVWKKSPFDTPTGIATDGVDVFFTIQDQDMVMSMPIAGGVAVTRMTGANYPGGVAVSNGHVYAATGSGILEARDDGGAPIVISPTSRFQTGGGDLTHTGIAIDGDTIFFTLPSLGIIASVPSAGGNATVLASNQDGPAEIDVTPTAIYWANTTSGVIMKLAR